MQRILEPEYMDTEEEVRVYGDMSHGEANLSFVETFVGHGGGRGLTLDIGTGPGDIPILLAQHAPEARIVAVDAAAHMLGEAAVRIARVGLADRITLHRADAKCLPFADGAFAGVYSNTILHHIPDPVAFLAEAGRVRSASGVLVIRDLFRPASEEEVRQLVDLHAAEATPPQRKMLHDSLRAALTLDEAREAAERAGLHGASVEMTSDRHYTIALGGR